MSLSFCGRLLVVPCGRLVAPSCTRSYIGGLYPGLSRTGIKRIRDTSGTVPRINRAQYQVYLQSVTPCTGDPTATVDRPATPSGWIPPPTTLPDLPYFVWRTADNQTVPVEHKTETKEGLRYTEISRIEGDLHQLRSDLEEFLQDNTVTANEVTGTIYLMGWRAFEIKKWLQLKGF